LVNAFGATINKYNVVRKEFGYVGCLTDGLATNVNMEKMVPGFPAKPMLVNGVLTKTANGCRVVVIVVHDAIISR
jgi:hypothetical protein